MPIKVLKTATKVTEEWYPTFDEFQPLVTHQPHVTLSILDVDEVPQDIFYVDIFGHIKNFVQYKIIPGFEPSDSSIPF